MKEARYFRGLTASAHTRTHIRLPKWDVTKLEPRRQEGFNIAEGKSGSWNSEKRRSFSEYLIWIAAQDMTITLDSVSKLVTQTASPSPTCPSCHIYPDNVGTPAPWTCHLPQWCHPFMVILGVLFLGFSMLHRLHISYFLNIYDDEGCFRHVHAGLTANNRGRQYDVQIFFVPTLYQYQATWSRLNPS